MHIVMSAGQVTDLVAVVQVHYGVVHWASLNVLPEVALQYLSFFGAHRLPASLLLRLQLPHDVRAATRPVAQCYRGAASRSLCL